MPLLNLNSQSALNRILPIFWYGEIEIWLKVDVKRAPHLVGVGEFELPAVSGPADDVLTARVGQQLQQELPQLNGATSCEAPMRWSLSVKHSDSYASSYVFASGF